MQPTARVVGPRHRLVFIASFLLAALLAGCGGGGGSSFTNTSNITSQGYRIVPAGGSVEPLGNMNLVLTTQSGVVSAGVDVMATQASALPASMPPPANSTLVQGAVYQLTTSPNQPVLNSTIRLTLAFPPGVTATAGTYQIFTYNNGQWVPLPGNIVVTTATPPTITADLNGSGNVPGTAFPYTLSSFSSSGLYAIFANALPFPFAAITSPAGAKISATSANVGFPLMLTTGGLNAVTSVTLTGTNINGGSVTLTPAAVSAGSNTVTVTVPANEFSAAGPVSITVTGADGRTTNPAVLTVS